MLYPVELRAHGSRLRLRMVADAGEAAQLSAVAAAAAAARPAAQPTIADEADGRAPAASSVR